MKKDLQLKMREELPSRNNSKEQERSIESIDLNNLFATYFYHAPDSVFILDTNGVIEKCNKAALKLTGLADEKEIIGKKVTAFVKEEDQQILQEKMEMFLDTGQPKTSVFQVPDRFAPVQFIEITSSLFCNENNELRIISNVRDVSMQKEMELKIKANEDRFRALLENSEDLIAIFNEQYRLTFISGNIQKFNGYSVTEIMDVNLAANIHKDDLPRVDAAFKELLSGSINVKTIEYRTFHKNGQTIHVESIISNQLNNPYIKGLVLNSRDITQRKKTEDELFEAKERAEQLYKVSPCAIFTINKNHVITSWNNRAAELTGYHAHEIIGKKCATFSLGDCTRECMLFDSEKHKPSEAIETKIITRDGKIKYVVKNTDYLRDKNGNITGGIESFEDITAKKEAFEEMYVSKEKAEESDRLKSAFLANMSHEIRTPMNGILGFINVLKDQNLSREEHDQYVDIIGTSGKHLLTLINDIIDISRIEAGQIKISNKPFSINKMMDELYEVFSMNIIEKEKKVRLHKFNALSSAEDIIEADPHRLRQVFTNLLSNAIKFTRQGSISYGVRKMATDNNMLEFFVADTGIGIPVDKQVDIFERFVQVDSSNSRNYGGTGLGLAISKGLINVMGGEIQLFSTPDKGTEFTFTLPFVKSNQTKLQDKNDSKNDTRPLNWHGKKALIVEDDTISFRYLEIILNATGIQIDHAISGEKALNFFEKGNKYDIVLMDIQLPGMSGYEVTSALLKINPKSVIIAQTANAMAEDIAKCYAHGCKHVVNKPVNREQLLSVMDKFLCPV